MTRIRQTDDVQGGRSKNFAVENEPEKSIAALIEARRLAWNARDVEAYRALLAPEATLTSATGKAARGREAILQLYLEQRQGAYQQTSIASTDITYICVHSEYLASAKAVFLMDSMLNASGQKLELISGINHYKFICDHGRWLISEMIGVPQGSGLSD